MFQAGGRPPSSCEMFSRLARCLARLSTNSSYQSRTWGIYGARSDLDNRQQASRPHWIIPDSSTPPPSNNGGDPPQMSRNCDKEVANHWRNTRALLFRSFELRETNFRRWFLSFQLSLDWNLAPPFVRHCPRRFSLPFVFSNFFNTNFSYKREKEYIVITFWIIHGLILGKFHTVNPRY